MSETIIMSNNIDVETTGNFEIEDKCVYTIEEVEEAVPELEGDKEDVEGDEDEGDEGDEGEEDEDEGEGEENYSNLTFTENSYLYAISIDHIPSFYVKDEKTARDKVWQLSKSLLSKEYLKGYCSYNLRISANEIHIIGKYRFFLIAYDQILHRVSYDKIKECV